MTPPPATMQGLVAWRRSSTALKIRSGSAAIRIAGTEPNSGLAFRVAEVVFPRFFSRALFVRLSTTGPGFPVVASRNAIRTNSGRRSAFSTRTVHLVTGLNSDTWSSS